LEPLDPTPPAADVVLHAPVLPATSSVLPSVATNPVASNTRPGAPVSNNRPQHHDTNNISPTQFNIHISFDMAPRSKRQRHLKKVFESQDRAIDGRFRGEVSFIGESCVREDILLPLPGNSEASDNDN
jgi:hypothetical protein